MKSKLKNIADYLVPSISNEYRRFRDRRRIKEEPTVTNYGFRFVGNKSMQDGTFEPTETKIIMSLLRSSDIFINIGANIGYYCCMALQQQVRAVAFEPMPNNLQLLQKNIALNNFDVECEIFPIALGDTLKSVKLFGDGTGASTIAGWSGTNNRYYSFAPCNKIDNILLHREFKHAVVLMDIEGGEFEALKGAKNFLQSNKAITWIVEICIDEHQPHGVTINPNLLETFELFWCSGYKSYSIEQSPKLIDRNYILNIVRENKSELATHNFIFTKEDLSHIIKKIM